jgi:hypothetical protein
MAAYAARTCRTVSAKMIDSTAADYGTLHKNQTGNNSGSLGSGHLAMRISTAPWGDASDLDEGTRGETSPVFWVRVLILCFRLLIYRFLQKFRVSQCGEGWRDGQMMQSGEKRHFFPLTGLQIGYVFLRLLLV